MHIQDSIFTETRLPRAAYCSDGKGSPAYIRRLAFALKKPQIQINPPALTFWLIFDIDRAGGGLAWEDADLPVPNWSAVNPENGHAHLVYGLEFPVCTSDAARIAPLRYLAAVYEAMARRLQADKGYAGLLTHNPVHKRWRTYWGTSCLYELGELAEYLELEPLQNSKTPMQPDFDFAYGRNCALFDKLRLWAYVAIRDYRDKTVSVWRTAVNSHAAELNVFTTPLSQQEVSGIAKSVAKWVWQRDLEACKRFSERQSFKGKCTRRETQVKAGKASGQARLAANFNKRVAAELMTAEGYTQQQIAEALEVSQKTISNWLKAKNDNVLEMNSLNQISPARGVGF